MKKFWVFICIIFSALGCSNMAVNSSTSIATDASGYAAGQFSDNRTGAIFSPSAVTVGGGGGGGGGAGTGLGAAWVGYKTGSVATEGDPLKFAQAITLINMGRGYAKSLSTSQGDTGGSKENIFTDKPLKQKNYQPFGSRTE